MLKGEARGWSRRVAGRLLGTLALCLVVLPSVQAAAETLPTPGASASSAPVQAAAGSPGHYWLVGADGSVYPFGGAPYAGSTGGTHLNQPIVGMAVTPDGGGYWLVARDGGIFSFGDARYLGSTGGMHLNQPIVGMAATPDGGGYWLVASDGGIFTFGDARYLGSTGGIHLNQPIVGMAATPDGGGYWLVARDGGIFTFGDARYLGSTGGIHLNQPIVGMAATPDGGGYWLVASDGGIFTFGDARYLGSTGGIHLNQPIVSMAATPDGGGYWLVASDGGIFSFGDALYEGSAAGGRLPGAVVAVASASGAATPGTASCPPTPPLAGQGAVVADSVNIPAVPVEALGGSSSLVNPPASDVPASYPGTVLRPADTTTYPGPRPAVVVLHGLAGDQCQMYWLAADLAGNGFVAVVLTSPSPADQAASEGVEIDAARSAVDFLGTAANPFAAQTNAGEVGVAGWSEGSIAASVVQELPDMHAVKAIVALDNLRASLRGDPGVPETFCLPPVEGPITPVVPALGLAEDGPCDVAPTNLSPGLKLSGWSVWVAAGVPSVELPLIGFTHFTFGSPTQLVGDLTVGWFEAWMEGSNTALATYTSCSVSGLPLAGVLSTTFQAGAFLPSLQLNTNTYAQVVAQRCNQTVGSSPGA